MPRNETGGAQPARLSARRGLAAGTLVLGGCDALSQAPWFRQYPVQRRAADDRARSARCSARTISRANSPRPISRRSSGRTAARRRTIRPIRQMAANGFADWRLKVDGLVETPAEFSLADLRAMPSRTQITRHDCVEGWSCIGKWKGVPLAHVLEQVKLKPEARYLVFHCADALEKTLDGSGQYYESIGLEDAFHPQTILAYDMNDERAADPARRAAPAPCRAPARLQDGEIRDAHRGGRELRRARARAGRLLGRPRLRMVRGNLVVAPPSEDDGGDSRRHPYSSGPSVRTFSQSGVAADRRLRNSSAAHWRRGNRGTR